MAGLYPTTYDTVPNLVKKIAWNYYDMATKQGITGLNPPSINDKLFDLYQKICYYTAALD